MGSIECLDDLTILLNGVAGLAAIAVLNTAHSVWRQTHWGFSASSLQKIYKAQPLAYDTDGQLLCINCQQPVKQASIQGGALNQLVDTAGAECQTCGLLLWPKCTRFTAILQNVQARL